MNNGISNTRITTTSPTMEKPQAAPLVLGKTEENTAWKARKIHETTVSNQRNGFTRLLSDVTDEYDRRAQFSAASCHAEGRDPTRRRGMAYNAEAYALSALFL
jgi:hypothetical protein